MEQPILNFRPDGLQHFSFLEKWNSGRKFNFNERLFHFEPSHIPRTLKKTPKHLIEKRSLYTEQTNSERKSIVKCRCQLCTLYLQTKKPKSNK